MDLLYTVNRNIISKSSLNQGSAYDKHSLCCISSRNIAAFTSASELEDTSNKTLACHVYVCDLNMPWHAYKISTNKENITALKWDLSGEKLVITDSSGLVQLWTMKDYILNDWTLIGSHCFPGEYILGVAWFHSGKRTSLVAEKKDSMQYNEKFSHLPYAPSVKQFGGRAAQGVFVVSHTGMLGTVLITHDKRSPISFATESIDRTRQNITAVDIGYAKNGQFLVAVSSGSFILPVRCFRVSIRKIDERCCISSQALPSFFLQDGGGSPNGATANAVITHLKFAVSETADSLIVAAKNNGSGFIEVWELSEKIQPVHKLFQSNINHSFKTIIWQRRALYRCHYSITAVTTPKLSIVTPNSYILVALSDSSIRCLSHDNLKEVAAPSLNTNIRHAESLTKYSRKSVIISCIDMSWLGCIFLSIDTNGSLYVHKLCPKESPMTLDYACTLLEFSLLSGLDWLDLLLCLRSPMIETLSERFDSSFNRQPLQVQQCYHMQFLCIKMSLHKMRMSGQNKAADLSSLFMVHSVAAAFKSLVRPSDIFHDKVPAERLPLVLTDNIITDVDQVLFHIEPKEFTVEPSTLQSLQQLIQWVSNLALNSLVRVPEQKMQIKISGDELLRDHRALNILRELLVIIRIWGLLRPSCLPVFIKSADNIDGIGLLFQLLSKLVQSNSIAQQIDDQLIDACCSLPNQIMIPQVDQTNTITAVAIPTLFYQSFPLQLEYGSVPNLTFVPELNPVEGCMQNVQTTDAIRHVYLGKEPLFVKQCTRCGAKSKMQNTTRTTAIRAWDQRWVRSCPCGGTWRV